MKTAFLLGLTAITFLVVVSCGKSGVSASIPLVKPPVMAAAPSGLKTTRTIRALDVAEIRSRFFSDGPTNLESLLAGIDARITEINTRSTESTRACLSNTPVGQSVMVMGESKTVFFQCYDKFNDNSGGMLFGRKDGVYYLYQNVGQGVSLAIVTPLFMELGVGDDYQVEAWISVGQKNGTGADTCAANWYACSYGVIHLKSNSATKAFEMTVAGTGFGFCGAHLKSDGTNLFVRGSAGGGTMDGTTWGCAAPDERCALASDITGTGNCADIGVPTFQITSLGVTGQSTFGTGVTLNGSSTDSVHFGYTVDQLGAIDGVTAF